MYIQKQYEEVLASFYFFLFSTKKQQKINNAKQ